eukprot:9440415-Karenia_brevis.AAC.1
MVEAWTILQLMTVTTVAGVARILALQNLQNWKEPAGALAQLQPFGGAGCSCPEGHPRHCA